MRVWFELQPRHFMKRRGPTVALTVSFSRKSRFLVYGIPAHPIVCSCGLRSTCNLVPHPLCPRGRAAASLPGTGFLPAPDSQQATARRSRASPRSVRDDAPSAISLTHSDHRLPDGTARRRLRGVPHYAVELRASRWRRTILFAPASLDRRMLDVVELNQPYESILSDRGDNAG